MGVNQASTSHKKHTKVFILSLIDITAPLPFEIIPAHFLDRAKPDEIEKFKSLINRVRFFPHSLFLYERSPVRAIPGEKEGHINFVSDELPPAQWKYWIVSHDGTNHEISRLQQASLLLKDEIEYGFQIISFREIDDSIIGGGAAMASYLSDDQEFSGNRQTVQISLDDLNNIKSYHELIAQLKPEYTHIKSAVKLFDELRALPRQSSFILVGLFSIIESLISHSPKLDFYHDSIKHQIRTKIPLLRKKFDRELHYNEFFNGGTSEDKILSKLYDYRSRIVHNGQSEMSDDFSNVLKSRTEVKRFLFELTKLLLIISLKEPEFMVDLKSC